MGLREGRVHAHSSQPTKPIPHTHLITRGKPSLTHPHPLHCISHLFPLRENQLQLPQADRKPILAVLQQIRPVLALRERHVELEQQLRHHGAQLHVRELLADAAVDAGQEGEEGGLVLDQLWLGVPALWDEGFGFDEGFWRCWRGRRRS